MLRRHHAELCPCLDSHQPANSANPTGMALYQVFVNTFDNFPGRVVIEPISRSLLAQDRLQE